VARRKETPALKRPKDATVAESEWVPIADLTPNPRNSRTHSPEQIAAIGESLERFGWVRPALVDDDGMIVAGHGTILGAQSKGYEEAKVVRVTGMSPANLRAYLIADNQLALNSGWDEDLLKIELSELEHEGIDASFMGFSDAQVDELFKPPKPPESFDSHGENIETSHKCPSCGYKWSGPAK
jgi:ParB family chromosome partitioning protein